MDLINMIVDFNLLDQSISLIVILSLLYLVSEIIKSEIIDKEIR